MRSCPNCGAALPDDALLCPVCGAPLAARTNPPSPADLPIAPAAPDYSQREAQQPPHQAPQYSYQPKPGPRYAPETETEPDGGLSTANYFWTLLLFAVPLVGLIFMIYWGFIGKVSPARKRLARAALIKAAVFLASGLAALVMLIALLFSQLHNIRHAFDFYFSGDPFFEYYEGPFEEYYDEFEDYYFDNPRFSGYEA